MRLRSEERRVRRCSSSWRKWSSCWAESIAERRFFASVAPSRSFGLPTARATEARVPRAPGLRVVSWTTWILRGGGGGGGGTLAAPLPPALFGAAPLAEPFFAVTASATADFAPAPCAFIVAARFSPAFFTLALSRLSIAGGRVRPPTALRSLAPAGSFASFAAAGAPPDCAPFAGAVAPVGLALFVGAAAPA